MRVTLLVALLTACQAPAILGGPSPDTTAHPCPNAPPCPNGYDCPSPMNPTGPCEATGAVTVRKVTRDGG